MEYNSFRETELNSPVHRDRHVYWPTLYHIHIYTYRTACSVAVIWPCIQMILKSTTFPWHETLITPNRRWECCGTPSIDVMCIHNFVRPNLGRVMYAMYNVNSSLSGSGMVSNTRSCCSPSFTPLPPLVHFHLTSICGLNKSIIRLNNVFCCNYIFPNCRIKFWEYSWYYRSAGSLLGQFFYWPNSTYTK